MAPAALRCHQKRGGESPPPSSSSLTFSLDGRRVSPLVHGLHGVGGARAPPRLDLSLSVSALQILPFHRFLNSRRSVTPIRLNFRHDLYLDISFLAAKEGHQPPYGVATRAQGTPDPLGRAPYLVAPSGIVSRWFFFPKITYIPKTISVSFYLVWTMFDMDFLWNKKHATNRNWHWALDQYVSPKNSIKSCQKYMKVVDYWHETIKNYRYDGDVSISKREKAI